MNQITTKNPGTPLSAAGLIMTIVALLGGIFVLLICTGWASFEDGMGSAIGLASGWTVFSVTGFVLALLGRNKSKAAAQKTGLGTAGLVIGLLAVLMSIGIIYAVIVAHSYV